MTGPLRFNAASAFNAAAAAARGARGGGSGGSGKRASSSLVNTFLEMLNTVKIYHWKTLSFATHKATDELYGTLNEKIDDFVEVLLGKSELGGRTKFLNVPTLKLTMTSTNEAFKKQMEAYKKFLLTMPSELGPDLLAIRDEILAALNKFLYLLTFR